VPDCRSTHLTFTCERALAGFFRSFILANEFISNWTLKSSHTQHLCRIINLSKIFLIDLTVLSPQFRRVCHLNAVVADHYKEGSSS
jgi:hypothetical protein